LIVSEENDSLNEPVLYQLTNYSGSFCLNQSLWINSKGKQDTPRFAAQMKLMVDQLTHIHRMGDRNRQLSLLEDFEARLFSDEVILVLPGDALSIICDIINMIVDESNSTVIVEHIQTLHKKLPKPPFDYDGHRMKLSDEQRLLSSLMTNYEKSVRPVLNASHAVQLKIGLTLNQIDVVSSDVSPCSLGL